MLGVSATLAAADAASSTLSASSLQPWLVLVIVGIALISSFTRAASRKKRAQNAAPHAPAPVVRGGQPGVSHPAGRQQGVAHQAAPAPYVGTLLNGVPMKSYDTLHGHQTTGFANERMKAEAELKRQLDALDAARRNGQVTAEQYAIHREAIFRNF